MIKVVNGRLCMESYKLETSQGQTIDEKVKKRCTWQTITFHKNIVISNIAKPTNIEYED